MAVIRMFKKIMRARHARGRELMKAIPNGGTYARKSPLSLVAGPASGRKVASGCRGGKSATRASRSSVKVSPTINRRTAQDTVSDDKRDLIMGA